MVAGFVVMVITGALLFYAIPVRSYQSLWFRIKVDRADPGGAERVRLPRRRSIAAVAEWDLAPTPPPAARRAGAASLVLWAIIVVAGRMIAYNWFDCDKQPQPQIVNVLAGCVVPTGGSAPMNLSMLYLLPVVEWVDAPLSKAISTSTWAFAVIESVHLLALSVIGGAVLIVDLACSASACATQTLEEVARDAQPWFLGSWSVMIVTGLLLFVSEPMKCTTARRSAVKMTACCSDVFAFTVRRKVTHARARADAAAGLKLVALVSLALWFGVGAGGRWIGFSG